MRGYRGRILVAGFAILFSALSQAQQPDESGAGAAAPSASSEKRGSDYSKEALVVEHSRTSYRFQSDGTGTRTEEMTIRVQSEAGVRQVGQLRFGYNSVNQDLRIEYVRVHKPDGSMITADPATVQDMTAPVVQVAPMYTDYREKHVTVPGLRPGDTLECKTVVATSTPLAPNQFWMEHTFRDDLIVLDEQLILDVPAVRAIKLKTQSDFEKYDTRTEGERRIYTWSWKNLTTRADREKAEKEADVTKKKTKKRRTDDKSPSVQMTTFASWDELGKWYAGLERDRRQPTDELRAKVKELTATLTDERQKVQAVYDFVSKNYRYVSLSFGLGRYQPHAAAEVFKNDYGDCKDKETLLAAMLEVLGHHVNTVLIHSRHKLEEDVPSPLQFDHVIGDLKLGDKTLWADTTTEVAPIGMLLLPLRNKKALEIEADGSTKTVTTTSEIPFEAFGRNEFDGQITGLGRLEGHSKLTVRGDIEVVLRGLMRRIPEARWSDVMKSAKSQQGLRGAKVTNVKIPDLNDTSKPLVVECDVAVPNFLDWTAKEANFSLPLERMNMPSLEEDDTEPAKLGAASTNLAIVRLRLPATFTVTLPAPVNVKRDYAEYSSTYGFADHVLSAERKLVIKSVEVEAVRASDLKAFTLVLTSDNRQQVHTENSGSGHAQAAAAGDTPVKELEDAAYQALRSRKFKESAELYKRITEKDPEHQLAWNNLGRSYMGLRRYDDAIAAYKKAIEVNAYDSWAWNNLGRVYEQQERYDDAIAAYKKQIDINPLDQYAHANLGGLYLKLHRDADAVPELERAVGITPDNAYVKVQLGAAYLGTGQTAKGMEEFEKALQKSSTASIWNGIAYNLALSNQQLDKAQQYAESAVSTTETLLRNVAPEKAEQAGLPTSANLATYWDTLGWVYFQQGKLDKAEQYIAPAWKHAEHGEIGYHLGRVYEKKGDLTKAKQMYAAAAAAEEGTIPDPLARLKELVGAESAEKLVAASRLNRVSERTLNLGWPVKEGSAEVLLTFASSGNVRSAKFLSGSDALKSRDAELSQLRLTLQLPDATEGLIHKGVITCTKSHGCDLVWLPGAGTEPVQPPTGTQTSETQ